MVTHSPFPSGKVRSLFGALAIAASLALPGLAHAQGVPPGIYSPGEPIVTGFPGAVPPDNPPASGDPLDKTFIDLDGGSMVIQQLQPDGPPAGQLIPSPDVFTAKARDVGEVFGIALDDADVTAGTAPNIYLAASSAYGLQIVHPDTDGTPIRLKTGAPDAVYMDGQWGTAGGATGTPGSIWKVDGTTGQVSLFTTIAANSGPGLGDIVFDPATEQFFVSDLDTGMIYRLALDGTIIDTFDHGVNGRPNHSLAAVPDDGSEMSITDPAFNAEDPATWGYTQPERRVYGMAVHGGRLYYAVADGPQVWSVGINIDGNFANDARWELDVTGLSSTNEIANIVFDSAGRMLLAQRGPQVGSYDYSVFATPKTSSVVRYSPEVPDDPTTPGTWVETPESYAIGFPPEGNNASGGIALGPNYDPDSNSFGGACSAYLWSSGDSLRDASAISPPLDPALNPPAQVHGLQGNDASLVRPDNDPPSQSFFTDFDGSTDDSTATEQGHVGDVEVWQHCQGVPGTGTGYVPPSALPPFTPPPGYNPPPGGNLTLHKVATPKLCTEAKGDWLCDYLIRVTNTGTSMYWGPISVDDWLPANPPGATMDFAPQPPWTCGPLGATEYECDYPPVVLYPGDSVDLYEHVTLPKTGNEELCWLDNDASLLWAFGPGDGNPADDFDSATAKIPNPNCGQPGGPKTNLKLTKIAHPQDCAPGVSGFDCTFFVRVTNTGPGDYNAPIQVVDNLGLNVAATVTPTPPWNCSQAGAQVTCDLPTTLLHPGQFVQFRLVATVPFALVKNKQVCGLDNTAQITKAPGGTDLNTDPNDDKDSAKATITSDACNPQKTDLSISKTGDGCKLPILLHLGPLAANCGYTITLKNQGPGVFNGPVTIVDSFNPPVPPGSVSFSPGGICSPSGGVFLCNLPATTHLAVGQTLAITVNVRVPLDGKICGLENTAQIKQPFGGSNSNTNPGNDLAHAVDHLPTKLCNPRGTDLSLTKTPLRCTPLQTAAGPPGFQCGYTVTVKNEGPGNFNGPIHFADQFTPAVSGISTGPGVTCSPQGGGYDCASSGNVNLTPGNSVSYTIRGLLPANTKACDLENRAKLTQPAGGTANNTNPGNDAGFATDHLINPNCSNSGGNTDLSLTKSIAPCHILTGGPPVVCFNITVKNEGPGPYNGPIAFTDTPVAGGVNVTGSAPVTCSAAGSGYNCVVAGNVSLAPGASASYLVRSVVDPKTCKLENDAKLTTPAGGTPDNTDPSNDSGSVSRTSTSPDCNNGGGTDLSLTKTISRCLSAVNGPSVVCYDITIKNEGPGAFNGPIHFTDTPAAGATSLTGRAPLTCTAAGPGYDCAAAGNVPLASGASVTYTVSTLLAPRTCSVGNQAMLTTPAGGSASNSNPGNDTDSASAILHNPDCNQQGGNDLSLTKTPADCPRILVRLGDVPLCFNVTITNNGPGSYSGPLQFKDTFGTAPDTLVTGSSSGYTCSGSGTAYTCDSSGSVSLASGAAKTYTVVAVINSDGGTNCSLDNTATLSGPTPGGPNDSNTGNDTGHATASSKLGSCASSAGGGGRLTITKTGTGCTPNSGRVISVFSCTFKVTVTATGGSVAGPITVHESAVNNGSPAGMDFDAGGNCSAAGVGSYDCVHSGALTGSWSFTATAGIGIAQARDGDCTVTNTATLAPPNSGSASASDTATSNGTLCGQQAPVAQCDLNQLKPDGTCCPDGQTWNGRQCAPPRRTPPVIRVCPDDSHGKWPNCTCNEGTSGKPGSCRPNGPQCGPHSSGTYPDCVCDPGYQHGRLANSCVPVTGGGGNTGGPQCGPHSSGTFPDCACDPGYQHGRLAGSCVPVTGGGGNTGGPQCGPHSSGTYPDCACDPGYQHGRLANSCVPVTGGGGNTGGPQCGPHSSGTYPNCTCDKGYQPGRRIGTCTPIPGGGDNGGKQCGPHSSGTYPDCACDSGYHHLRGSPLCVANPATGGNGNGNGPQCGAHSSGTYPDCVCDRGYAHLRSRTACTLIPPKINGGVLQTNPGTIVVKQCPKGSVGTFPNCACPKGTVGKPPRCLPAPSTLQVNPKLFNRGLNPRAGNGAGPVLR